MVDGSIIIYTQLSNPPFMQTQKKLIALSILLLNGFIVLPVFAAGGDGGADFDCQWGNPEAPLPGQKGKSICDLAGKKADVSGLWDYAAILYKFATGAITAVGLIMVVIGGYRYMTAGGNAASVQSAKSLVIGALLGITIALTSYTILETIAPQFVGK